MRGDRVGLIIFSSDAFVQCPLTQDREAFNLQLDEWSGPADEDAYRDL